MSRRFAPTAAAAIVALVAIVALGGAGVSGSSDPPHGDASSLTTTCSRLIGAGRPYGVLVDPGRCPVSPQMTSQWNPRCRRNENQPQVAQVRHDDRVGSEGSSERGTARVLTTEAAPARLLSPQNGRGGDVADVVGGPAGIILRCLLLTVELQLDRDAVGRR